MDKWQDIASAPKDGTWIRARGRNWGRQDHPYHHVDACWSPADHTRRIATWTDRNGDELAFLTDWKPIVRKPLPTPPETTA